MKMKRIFKDTITGELIEVPEVRPGLVNFHGCLLKVSEASAYSWEERPEESTNQITKEQP
jgi:hypothetical protein